MSLCANRGSARGGWIGDGGARRQDGLRGERGHSVARIPLSAYPRRWRQHRYVAVSGALSRRRRRDPGPGRTRRRRRHRRGLRRGSPRSGRGRRRRHHHQLRVPGAAPGPARAGLRGSRRRIVAPAGAVGRAAAAAGQAGRRDHGGCEQPHPTAPRMRGRTGRHPGRRDRGRRWSSPECCSATSWSSTWTAHARDVITAARRLVERNRDVGAIVLECTNMPPYAACVSRVVGLPVYDFYSFVCWFQAGLRPRRFDG